MLLHPVLKFHHNSKLASSEPRWDSVKKTALPRTAFADMGNPEKKSSWKYPHHWVQKGGGSDSGDIHTSGTLHLHKGGLIAAYAAAYGARSGQQASAKVKSHLESHREAIGLEKSEMLFLDIKKSDDEDERQLVYAEVYAPNLVDTDNEFMSEDDIEKMAHEFLSSGKINKIDVQHDFKESGCLVVESFIARKGWEPFVEGAWVMGVWCPDEIWAKIKSGELNGFSFAGITQKYPAKVLVEVTKQLVGITEKSTVDIIPSHEHTFTIYFDNKGQIVSGKTDVVQAHSHLILKGTATEIELDHSHRLILE